ncbi:unnamed protein product [Urochloa humidicola]
MDLLRTTLAPRADPSRPRFLLWLLLLRLFGITSAALPAPLRQMQLIPAPGGGAVTDASPTRRRPRQRSPEARASSAYDYRDPGAIAGVGESRGRPRARPSGWDSQYPIHGGGYSALPQRSAPAGGRLPLHALLQPRQAGHQSHLGGYFDGGPLAEALHCLPQLRPAANQPRIAAGDDISWPGDLPAVVHQTGQERPPHYVSLDPPHTTVGELGVVHHTPLLVPSSAADASIENQAGSIPLHHHQADPLHPQAHHSDQQQARAPASRASGAK